MYPDVFQCIPEFWRDTSEYNSEYKQDTYHILYSQDPYPNTSPTNRNTSRIQQNTSTNACILNVFRRIQARLAFFSRTGLAGLEADASGTGSSPLARFLGVFALGDLRASRAGSSSPPPVRNTRPKVRIQGCRMYSKCILGGFRAPAGKTRTCEPPFLILVVFRDQPSLLELSGL